MVLKCMYYNATDPEPCKDSYEKCAKEVDCGDENRFTCYAVWDPVTNLIKNAGCLEAQHAYNNCNAYNCVGQPKGRLYYCCCNQNNCNEKYELPPKSPEKPTQISSPIIPQPVPEHPPHQSTSLWLIPIIVLLVTITLLGAIYYGYHRRRQHRRRHTTSNSTDRISECSNLNSRELDELDHHNSHNSPFDVRLRNSLVPRDINNTSVYFNNNGQIKQTNINESDLNAHHSNNKIHHSHRPMIGLNGVLSSDNLHHHGEQLTTTRFGGDYQNGSNSMNYTNGIETKNLELLEEIGSGRFGRVRRAKITDGSNVIIAVKIIPATEQHSWFNEIRVFNCSKVKHPNILGFLGFREVRDSSMDNYWLLVDYASKGSLYSYLRSKTVNWNEFTRISLGIVHGLSHLHDADIAHRDFKSKNVLLKHDLTPCITDFGVAAVLDPAIGSQMDHRKKYLQVGTPRYMAPEVLECSVTFTKTSFTKIDVYALSLVLWELLSRCHKLQSDQSMDPNVEVSPLNTGDEVEQSPGCRPYMLPFEDVAGPNPSISTMRQIVVTEKLRPPIKPSWRLYPVSEFCRAIEDGWEYDHDARISASCFVERLECLQHGTDNQ